MENLHLLIRNCVVSNLLNPDQLVEHVRLCLSGWLQQLHLEAIMNASLLMGVGLRS